MKTSDKFISEKFNINPRIVEFVETCEDMLKDKFAEIDEVRAYNHYRVLKAMHDVGISERHFNWMTGYAHDDVGKEAVENVYANVFGTEAAIVRPGVVNGTHAIAICLFGILRPGDEFIYASGAPYDTMEEIIGIHGIGQGSLADYGIIYKKVNLTDDGGIDYETLAETITTRTKMVCLQRSVGYEWRRSLTVEEIGRCADFIHVLNDDIVVMVDNCYGEFVGLKEPTEAGADICAGSLIKNPGGGLALTGGYVCGRQDLVDMVSYRLTCPGIGSDSAVTFGQNRNILQGLFQAPQVVSAAMRGAILCGLCYKKAGYEINPHTDDPPGSIIQAVRLHNPDKVKAFCNAVQSVGPVDYFVMPVEDEMPGYEDKVIMAAPSFVQGSSIELSADAPMRAPYTVFFQGGLTYDHSRLGVMASLDKIIEIDRKFDDGKQKTKNK